jgi:hypothetical protein
VANANHHVTELVHATMPVRRNAQFIIWVILIPMLSVCQRLRTGVAGVPPATMGNGAESSS